MKDDESVNPSETTVVRLGFEDKVANDNETIVEPSFSIDKDPYVIEMNIPSQYETFGNDTAGLDATSEDLSSFTDFQVEDDNFDNN